LKRRNNLGFANIIEKTKERESEIYRIEKDLFLGIDVKVFHGSNGEEIRSIKRFEETCFLMNQVTAKDAKTMTVLEYLQANETLSKTK
jgi:hypothetical protein